MDSYKHPIDDSEFLLKEVLGIDQLAEQYQKEEIGSEFQIAVLQEAAKICESLVAPLNRTGDINGSKWEQGVVTEAPGFRDAYLQYSQNGWTSLTCDPNYGGQGLPQVLGMACNEILYTANLSFALAPMLTSGAIDAIYTHAEEDLKNKYLPKMISGEWTGTMNLTEPDAGSDLAAVKTKAFPEGDHYRISGQKIFITWGEHSMTDNIVHLVLARLPDAPAGVKGISLFLVPKFLVDENGLIGERNDVSCVSLEHKLGIHASPTCAMSFGDDGGAIGYLVGSPHNGLACMFTMMNHARQGVGLQGLGVSERAYQLAREYAKERLQGTRSDGSRYNIMNFADVRRQLLLMKSGCEAMRALGYKVGLQHDIHALSQDAKDKARLELFTPIVKLWMTELSQELTSLGVQVHGGMGYVEETGAAQYLRDARILPIYEGTSAIQGNDLVGRKILHDGGETISSLLTEMNTDLASVTADSLKVAKGKMHEALRHAGSSVEWILNNAQDKNVANAVGTDLGMLLGYLSGGWLMLLSAQAAESCLQSGDSNPEYCNAKILTTRFYCDHYLPRVSALAETIEAGSDNLLEMSEEMF